MPLFAALIGSIAQGLVAILSQFMSFKLALKYAAYLTWMAVFSAFLVSVFVCVSSLLMTVKAIGGAASGINGGMFSAFAMGLGMLIPANAAGVLSCVASVWIATNIYKVQKQGIQTFGA